MNRAARRAPIFQTEQDYDAFVRTLSEAKGRLPPMRILAYIVMPNHWHLLLWPFAHGDLSRFMHWLTTIHSCRWNVAHGTCGAGAVYQSRFKSIPVQEDVHVLRVWRYVERNALRANLVSRAEQWTWSSLNGRADSTPLLDAPPIDLPIDWIDIVNEPQTQAEIDAIRKATEREEPYGHDDWREEMRERAARRPTRMGRPRNELRNM
jgi:putative transposase